MSDDDRAKLVLQPVSGWNVHTIGDGSSTALVFGLPDGPVAIGMSKELLSRFIDRIIVEAANLAASQPPDISPQTVNVDPVPVSALSIVPGRVQSEAIMMMQVGNLNLSFSIDLNILAQMCKDLKERTRFTPVGPAN